MWPLGTTFCKDCYFLYGKCASTSTSTFMQSTVAQMRVINNYLGKVMDPLDRRNYERGLVNRFCWSLNITSCVAVTMQ